MPRTKIAARATAQDAELARQIGGRLREARQRAGLTQQQLAGERYTKAYISALETGIARPSMVALNYLSERLGLAPSHFLDEPIPAWTRLEVDMRPRATPDSWRPSWTTRPAPKCCAVAPRPWSGWTVGGRQ
jgi:hypothetical protein